MISDSSKTPGSPATVVDDAVAAFLAGAGPGPGAPVLAIIPALNEQESVAEVVQAVPRQALGLDVDVLVVDDGSSDETAKRALGAGAAVCRFATNQGQGVAFQAGYRLAEARGARFVVTLDADGQFDPTQMPALLAPLVEGRADFVNGSRRLGRSETDDKVRSLGVSFFGRLISILAGRPVTDPSNGFRAMKVELVAHLPLVQRQYQTSEVIICALAAGADFVEVPVVVLPRRHGESKKGRNLRYGFRFGRVVIGTAWAQRRGLLASRRGRARPRS